MKKFLTVNNYATEKGLDPTTVRDHITKHKLLTQKVYSTAPILVVDNDDTTGANVISFLNLKGGCSKSTTSAHVAIWLAKLNYKVLLIDTDHQNQLRLFFPEQSYKYTIVDILKGNYNIKDCIYHIEQPNFEIDFIFSDYELAIYSSFATQLTDGDLLAKNLITIKNNYDFIIIDTSPDFDTVNMNVARASDSIIIPLVPNPMHISGMQHNIKAIIQVAKVSIEKIKGILPTIVEKNFAQHTAYIKLLKEEHSNLVFDNYIPKDAFLAKSPDFRNNVFDYREKSKGSQALKKFTWELLQRL